MVSDMREEYDVKNLNPRKNPYAKTLKKTITIKVNPTTLQYFKDMSDEMGVPYQTLMNMYLDECVREKKRLQFV